MDRLTELEQTLVSLLLAGDHPALAVLRAQLVAATVAEREASGIGFFTHFAVPPSVTRLPVKRWVIGDVNFHMDGLEYPAGALLFIADGALSMLEGFTYASEPWPAEPTGLVATYTTRGRPMGNGFEIEPVATRDLGWLREQYAKAERRAAAG